MKTLACPSCRSEFVRRSGRKTLGERLVSLVWVLPFRCQLCQRRFLAFRPGERYVRAAGAPERREYERLPVEAWSALWVGDRRGEARVIDMSVAGCSIETDTPVPEGEIVQLQVAPPGTGRPIAVEQAVVRSVQPGRLGIQFIRVQEDEEGRLRQYLYEVFVSRLK
jgi:hypothetical protein